MPIQTDQDRPGSLNGRNPEAAFTEGAEAANVTNANEILDGLFAHKNEMASAAKSQLGSLFNHAGEAHGRAKVLGMTAREASGVVDRAFARR